MTSSNGADIWGGNGVCVGVHGTYIATSIGITSCTCTNYVCAVNKFEWSG